MADPADLAQDEALARALQEEFSLQDAAAAAAAAEDDERRKRRDVSRPLPTLNIQTAGGPTTDVLTQFDPMSASATPTHLSFPTSPSKPPPTPARSPVPPSTSSPSTAMLQQNAFSTTTNESTLPPAPPSLPPRTPDKLPEPREVPFDFNRFLEQMRHRSAIPITKYFKSFLREFDRRPWNVNEQMKIIHDFLNFIFLKMRECELWAHCSEQEMENAKEGMEKLVMNRLYQHTFSPSTADDAERDAVFFHKIEIFRWVTEAHLDIPPSVHNESFLQFAQSELSKINNYKAPRDKLICILNSCKVIFGLIKHVEGEGGADKFFPVLVYVVLKANPSKLVSNVQYIARFRQPAKLQSEAGYYLTNLMGAISFIESMDTKSLSITQEEFESNIERTMLELQKERPIPEEPNKEPLTYENAINPTSRRVSGPSTPNSSRSQNINTHLDRGVEKAQALLEKGEKFVEKTIGKLFSDGNDDDEDGSTRLDRSKSERPTRKQDFGNLAISDSSSSISETRTRTDGYSDEDRRNLFPGVVGSSVPTGVSSAGPITETPEYREAFAMLRSMFSAVDPEVVDLVLQENHGQLSPTIDGLLEIANGPPSKSSLVDDQVPEGEGMIRLESSDDQVREGVGMIRLESDSDLESEPALERKGRETSPEESTVGGGIPSSPQRVTFLEEGGEQKERESLI